MRIDEMRIHEGVLAFMLLISMSYNMTSTSHNITKGEAGVLWRKVTKSSSSLSLPTNPGIPFPCMKAATTACKVYIESAVRVEQFCSPVCVLHAAS
jgi:hypothetical protein